MLKSTAILKSYKQRRNINECYHTNIMIIHRDVEIRQLKWPMFDGFVTIYLVAWIQRDSYAEV